MGGRRILALATLAAMAFAAACGSLVGSPDPVTPADGDGGSTTDGAGATDGRGATDGGPVTACTHMFCADFEGPALYGFDTAKPPTPVEDGGWFLSSTQAVSGSHSLGTLVYPSQTAQLEKELGTDLKRITVELRLRFERFEYVSGKANPLTIHCNNGGDVALIKASDAKIQISSTDDHDVAARTSGVWHRLLFDFDIPGAQIYLTEMSETGADAGSNMVGASSGCSGATSLRVGDDPSSTGGTYELYIDDVLADWQ